MEPRPPFISRIIIKNYKSIARCDVHLGALQFLVGRNGSGKSNFLDALAFVRDALMHNSVVKAMKSRFHDMGILHRSPDASKNFSILLEFNLPSGMSGEFAFEIRAESNSSVVNERCIVNQDGKKIAEYEVRDGEAKVLNLAAAPPVATDRLYLQNMSALNEYRPIYDALRMIMIYNINPPPFFLSYSARIQQIFEQEWR